MSRMFADYEALVDPSEEKAKAAAGVVPVILATEGTLRQTLNILGSE